jgi:PAS domain S-box-containing protein
MIPGIVTSPMRSLAASGNIASIRQATAFAAFGLVYYLLAAYAGSLSIQAAVPLFIWPAHGVALGVLLVAPKRRWAAYLGLVAAATVLVGLQMGFDPRRIVITALVNCAQPLFVAAGLQRLAGPRVQIDTVKGLSSFLVGMLPLVAAMGILDASFSYLRFHAAFREAWTVTFISTMLGMLLTAPLILAWSRSGWKEATDVARGRLPELIVLYVCLVVTTFYVFASRPPGSSFIPPLAYLTAPFLIWAALRFGLRAATFGLSIFGLLCYALTAHGFGMQPEPGVPDVRALLHLQGYLATVVVTTLFAAALHVERQEAARETEAWRNRHEAVIRASGNLLYEFDPADGSVIWDGDTLAVLGAARERLGTMPEWMDRVHPDDRIRERGLRQMMLDGELAHMALEYRFRRDDGDYITIGVNAYRISMAGVAGPGQRVIGFVKDVSEKVRAEEERQRLAAQLRQAEKMQAVGHLAGGIAHDFNNILGAILGYGELAQQKAQGDVRRYLDTIMSAGNRAKSLVTQILSYSRAEGAERVPVIVAPIGQEVVDLIRGSSPETIEVRYDITGADEATVMGDPTRLHQLLMNLSTNAVQAMGGGGTLHIEVAQEAFTAPRTVRSGEIPAGEYVRVRVGDSGYGIAPEVLDRIFEPFFTTKPAGRGTGLGLALVHSVVVEHHGFIEVESELGRGTTFTIWIPRVQAEMIAEQAPQEMPRGQGQVILAVDDEVDVLHALEEMLASLGYEPVGFSSSREALEAARQNPRRFEAVVSDEVMPEMTGTQMAIELRKLDPTLPIVIASGYGGAGFETRALSAGVNRVLKKPYRMSEIAESLAAFFAHA